MKEKLTVIVFPESAYGMINMTAYTHSYQCSQCGRKIGSQNGNPEPEEKLFCDACGQPMQHLETKALDTTPEIAEPTAPQEPQPNIEQPKAEPEQTDGKATLTFSVEETQSLNADGVFVYISPKGKFYCRYGESEVFQGKKYRHLEPLSLAELEALGVTAIEETYNAQLEDQSTDITENEPEPETAKEADSEDKITFEE